MNLNLVITILIIAVSIGVYFVFLLRIHKRIARREHGPILDEGSSNEKVISESPIYHETKEPVKHLRAGLDRFGEIVDTISAKEQTGSKEEIDNAYKEGIPGMHRSIVDARDAAYELLASVENKPLEKAVRVDIFGSSHHAPTRNTSGSPTASRADRLLASLVTAINEVSPGIAKFYFALTEQDEHSQLIEAIDQTKQIIEQLDAAIKKMIALEKELTDT
ncbi:MAG: hypothetical protein GY847_20955 [Proteobacteria bacterium]|nr:hypothetical protein [Pseudomonadota bacterium]